MGKFVKIMALYKGFDEETILNVDDIARVIVGPNIVVLKTPHADGSNQISVKSETIKELEKFLEAENEQN